MCRRAGSPRSLTSETATTIARSENRTCKRSGRRACARARARRQVGPADLHLRRGHETRPAAGQGRGILKTTARIARLFPAEHSTRVETWIRRRELRERARARDFQRERREFAAANSRSAAIGDYGVGFLLFTIAESIARRNSSIGCAPTRSLPPIMKLGVEDASAA